MKRGFTYIEILITLAVIAVLFIPMMQLFTHGVYSATVSGDMITAVNLARWEMERLKNLNATKAQLKATGDIWTPPLSAPPFQMNNARWRTLCQINPESDPLEVRVKVFLAEDLKKPVATLFTMVEDSVWADTQVVQQ